MAVALVDGRIRRQAIEIALALYVPHPYALGALDDDVQRTVIMRSVFVFEIDVVWRAHYAINEVHSRFDAARHHSRVAQEATEISDKEQAASNKQQGIFPDH